MQLQIGPSILNSDLSNLGQECAEIVASGADFLHLDVMDGHFVPNLTFGHPVVKCLRPKVPDAFLEAHMMVSNPKTWVESMADAGIGRYVFHLEAAQDVEGLARRIRDAGMQVGIAINPKTPVNDLIRYADICDLILVMTVEPGFGGQKFMADMMPKVEILRQNFPSLNIEVDGGIGIGNVECCAKAGANVIVAGTAITGAADKRAAIAGIREAWNKAL